jgi:hypothetical protein
MSDAWDNMVEGFKEAFGEIGTTLGDWIPRILVAVLAYLVGRWILRLIRTWTQKLLEMGPVRSVFDGAGITNALAPSGRSAPALVASVIYAFLMLVLWLIVFRVLQIEPIEDLLERLIAVVPLILVAVALVIIAAAVAAFVADLVAPYAERRGVSWLPLAVRVLIIVGGALTALDLLEISFAEDIVKIVTAAAGVALAIAFGIGGIDTAKRWWAKYAAPREG